MNIFPSSILKAAKKATIMVELKSGDTYNGILEDIDKFMNIKLSEVTFTAKDNSLSMKIDQIFIKGSALKYFQMDEACVDKAIEEAVIVNEQKEESKQKYKAKKDINAAPSSSNDKPKKKFEKSRGGYQGKAKSRGG